jgi:hypothetical protein
MGFEKEVIERSVVYANVKSVEECLTYLLPNNDEYLDEPLFQHSFVS